MNTPFSRRVAIGLSLVLFSTPLSARDWTDSTGKYKIEGDLLKIEPDRVQLKKADGTEIWVPIARLGRADREFVRSHSEKERARAVEGPPVGLKVDGSAQWSRIIKKDKKGRRLPPDLEIQVIITGRAAAEAVAIGKLKLESVKNGVGKRIQLAESFDVGMLKRGFIGMDRNDMPRRYVRPIEGPPEEGVLLAIPVKAAPQTKMIKHARGSVMLKTGGEHHSVAVKIAAAELDKPIDNKALAAAGLNVTIRKIKERQVTSQITEGQSYITNLSLVDASGREIGLHMGVGGWANDGTYTFMSLQPLPADAAIRIDVTTGVKEVVVPFSLEKLPVEKTDGMDAMFQF